MDIFIVLIIGAIFIVAGVLFFQNKGVSGSASSTQSKQELEKKYIQELHNILANCSSQEEKTQQKKLICNNSIKHYLEIYILIQVKQKNFYKN